jgi:cytidylate kinase
MNKNEQFVITINRELGSGGRTVGRLLAEKLGVPFFDKALIKALQEKYHLTVDNIEKLKGSKHSWWDDVVRILDIGSGMNGNYYLPKKAD